MRKKIFAIMLMFSIAITSMLPNCIVKAESNIIETSEEFGKPQYLGDEYIITNPRLVYDGCTYFYADVTNVSNKDLEIIGINICLYDSNGMHIQTIPGVISHLRADKTVSEAINAGITEDWRNEDISYYRIEIKSTGEMSRTEKEEITIEDGVMYYNNHKYQYFEGGISWYDAQAKCEENGGNLLVISSQNEQGYINEYITSLQKDGYLTKQNIWLGATIKNGVLDWVVDEGAGYTNWASGEPNNVYDMQDCVMMYTPLSVNGDLGYWNDESGNGRNWEGFTLNDTGYICEWSEESDEDSTDNLEYVSYQGHQYKYFNDGMSWKDAQAKCEEMGGHLLVISSEEEQEFINSYVKERYEAGDMTKWNIWLGATIKNGVLSWVADETGDYSNWNAGEPNNMHRLEDCVMMYTQLAYDGDLGYWNDESSNGRNDGGGYTLDKFGYICEWDGKENSENNINTELIEKVSLYTSNGGGEYAQKLNEIVQKMAENNVSQDEILNVLNQFFVERGYDNIQEGITYLYDATNAKMAYDYLVYDDVYCAYQYCNYLNTTDKGKIARGLLWSSGWIFNNDLLQFIDPSTYIMQETNSIENYKTMLLDFMNATSQEYEVLSFAKKAISVVEGAVDETDGTLKAFYTKKIEKCETTDDIKNVLADYLEQVGANGSDKKIELNVKDFKKTSELLNYFGESVWLYSEFCDNITHFILLEARLETIYRYNDFLQSIVDGKEVLPYGLVVAAKQLQEELINPYISQAKNILGEISDKFAGDVYNLDELIMGKTFAGAVGTIELGATIVDLITEIGKIVKQSAYVEAYAYLGMYYSTLLNEAKTQFLQNKSVENAWNFFDTYQLLFQIRQKGEVAYLKMSETGGIVEILCDKGDWDYFGIADKKAFIKERLEYMNEYCYFGLENAVVVGGDHFYAQKIVVECPVSIELYDKNNNLLYFLQDGVECDEENGYGRFVCQYDAVHADYVKVIYLNDALEYNIRIVGEDAGKVTYSIIQMTNDGNNKIYGFNDLIVNKNSVIEVNTNENQYTIDQEGDGRIDIEAFHVDKTAKYVQFDYQNGKQIVVSYADEYGIVEMPNVPEKEGYEFEGWYYELNGKGEKFLENTIIEDSITLYANWTLKDELENPNAPIVPEETITPTVPSKPEMPNDSEISGGQDSVDDMLDEKSNTEIKVPPTGDSINPIWLIVGVVGVNMLFCGYKKRRKF